MYRLFVVEDDPGIAAAIITQAEQWGMSARAAQNFRHVAEEFAEFSPHIALLDISLPCYDGYYWCGEIRKISKTPIIFISSASDNMNIITPPTAPLSITASRSPCRKTSLKSCSA